MEGIYEAYCACKILLKVRVCVYVYVYIYIYIYIYIFIFKNAYMCIFLVRHHIDIEIDFGHVVVRV